MVEIMDECDDGWKTTTVVGINLMLQARSSISEEAMLRLIMFLVTLFVARKTQCCRGVGLVLCDLCVVMKIWLMSHYKITMCVWSLSRFVWSGIGVVFQ